MIEVIPESCLSIIPLKPEAVSSCSEESELLRYLVNLFDKEGQFIDELGRKFPVNYSGYGRNLFEEGRKQCGGKLGTATNL